MSQAAIMRVLKKAITTGGKMFNAGDHAGTYTVYLDAAKTLLENHTAEDAELKGIVESAISNAEKLKDPTEQCWELRQAFDLIKDRGRGGNKAPPPETPQAESSSADSLNMKPSCSMGRAAEAKKEVRVKREKQDKQLVNTCKEIHQTEEAYVADLKTIVGVFMTPAREQDVLSAKDALEIFMNVEELLRCNTALLEALAPLGVTSEDDPTDLLAVVAKAFSLVAPFFVMYTAYCAKYDGALKRLAAARKESAKLHAFLASQTQQPACKGLALESFLIKPIQRLTKYPLFFKDLQRHIPPEHAMRTQLEDAARLVAEVAQRVNTNIDDPAAKMAERLQPLGAEWLNLTAPHRGLDAECHCHVHADKRFPAAVYVFTDLLLVVKKKDGGELRPWLLARLADCMLGDGALLGEPPAGGGGLYSGPVELPESTMLGGFFGGRSKEAESVVETILCVRVAGEEPWWVHCASEAEMGRLLDAVDSALAKVHKQERLMRQRGLSRRQSAIGTNEAVIDELCARLQLAAIKKGQRCAQSGRDGVSLPSGVVSLTSKSRTLSRPSKGAGGAPVADEWAPAALFAPTLPPASEGARALEPQTFAGRWFTAAHLPYFRERKAFGLVESFAWDAATKALRWERTFHEGGHAGPQQTAVREGSVTEGSGRDWRLRHRVGALLLPQTAYAVVHVSASGGAMMLAHGDAASGGAGLSYLWLLTRTSPAADKGNKEVDAMMDLAKDMGFDVSNLRLVPHQ